MFQIQHVSCGLSRIRFPVISLRLGVTLADGQEHASGGQACGAGTSLKEHAALALTRLDLAAALMLSVSFHEHVLYLQWRQQTVRLHLEAALVMTMPLSIDEALCQAKCVHCDGFLLSNIDKFDTPLHI